MKITTKYFGEMDILESDVIRFSHGIPGFPDETAFIFLPLTEDSPFTVMQSVSTPGLAFITTSPFLFFPDYSIDINDQTVEQLAFESASDATVYVILTIKEPFQKSTANLAAPVLVNHAKQLGKQVVLEKTRYTVSHPLFEQGGVQDARAHAQEK
jgi:flagellar assembly factor FliW